MHLLIRALVFLVAAMALPCTGNAQPVTLVSTEYPPYFAKTLPEGGTLLALTRAALGASGRELTVVYRPWARLRKELEHGSHDGVVASGSKKNAPVT